MHFWSKHLLSSSIRAEPETNCTDQAQDISRNKSEHSNLIVKGKKSLCLQQTFCFKETFQRLQIY